MPKRTFKDTMTLGKGNDQIELHYFGRGHTNGDAFVVFPALRVMHAGDIFSGKNIPLLDANNGGSGVEIGKTLAKAADVQGRRSDHHRAQHGDDGGRPQGVRSVQQRVRRGRSGSKEGRARRQTKWRPPGRFPPSTRATPSRRPRACEPTSRSCGTKRSNRGLSPATDARTTRPSPIVMILGGVVAQGHHSIAAAYDRARPVKLDAVLVEFAMVQPHPFVVVEVKDGETRCAGEASWTTAMS